MLDFKKAESKTKQRIHANRHLPGRDECGGGYASLKRYDLSWLLKLEMVQYIMCNVHPMNVKAKTVARYLLALADD